MLFSALTRRAVFSALLTLAIAGPALLQTAQAASKKHPNVVFILTDDQRWDAISISGKSPYLKTPNIDRIGKEGVYFKNAFCTTSLCSPSRASILSGLYAHSHGVVNNFTDYPKDMASFPRRLHDAGYDTAYIGKWHMGEDNDEKRPGFDYFVTHKGQGQYFDTEFNVDGTRKVIPGYYTHVVTDLALDWMKDRKDKPFLLMLGHKAPHSFYIPEPKYTNSFNDVKIPYPDTAFHLDKQPDWIKQRLNTWHGIYGPLFEWRKNFPDSSPAGVTAFENMTRAYWGTILSVDDSVGILYNQLKEMGELDNTLFIFTTDNGLLGGEHGMVDKRTAHEPSIRVPLVVRYPGLTKKAKVIEQQVLTLDFAPSILDICGVEQIHGVHGRSWKNLVKGGAAAKDWRTAWYYEYNYEKQFPYTPNVRAIRTDDWKYIHYPPGDGSKDKHMEELYNIKSDPDEAYNLINDPILKYKAVELRAELEQLIKAAGADPDKMPMDEGIKGELPDKKIR
jgi:arylsulfatase A-like enzyme